MPASRPARTRRRASKTNQPGVRSSAALSSSPPAPPTPPGATAHEREAQTRVLLEVTQIPTAAGKEQRAVEYIRRWVAARPSLRLSEDAAGNLVVAPRKRWRVGARPPVFITAHLDHPAFVVESVIAPGTLEVSFRGGVMDDYFEGARIVVHPEGGASGRDAAIGATLSGASTSPATPMGKLYIAELDDAPGVSSVRIGDVATWALPPAEVRKGAAGEPATVHTLACDDLSAVAAALCAMDRLLALANDPATRPGEDVRLLFTRAEEIGFIGAIAACKLGTMPPDARVVALENSRSFADSPIGAGPIVRVGDRLSIFDPRLTDACAQRAEHLAGAPATPRASQKAGDVRPSMPWQRKLMAGGACEASVYCAYGYSATCLCLPLGNYHNMSDLASVQDGTYDRAALGPPRVGREFIGLQDYFGLIDLLVAIGQSLPLPGKGSAKVARFESLLASRQDVLGRPILSAAPVRRASRARGVKAASRGRGGKKRARRGA